MSSPANYNAPSQPARRDGYRPDIDGLRAIAVIAVTLFHAGIAPFSGGFIGVDIFFVISGYLITTIIAREVDARHFSYLHFYTRRFLRILPAALFITAITGVASFFLLLPGEYANLGQAMARLAYFTSNQFFMHINSDYWNQSSLAVQPLLHTWSLSIEEQFYIFLPPILLFSAFLTRRLANGQNGNLLMLTIVSILAVMSFIYGERMLKSDSSMAFYFIASRAWELLIGSALALFLRIRPNTLRPVIRDGLGLASLITLAACILFYTERTAFPGFHALLPCVAAAMVIYAGSGHSGALPLTTKLLGFRPVVFMGLISYSMYLWHWPVLVLCRSITWKARGLPPVPVAVLLLGTVLLAYLTWKYVENPFRRMGRTRKSQQAVVLVGILSLVGLFAGGKFIASIGNLKSEVKQPVPPVLTQLLLDTKTTPGIRCEGSPKPAIVQATGGGCEVGDKSVADTTFAVIGDSHARMWTEGVEQMAKSLHVKGLVLAHSSCIPLLGLVPPTRKACTEITAAKIDFLKNAPVNTVILAGYWMEMAKTDEEIDTLVAALSETSKALTASGKKVYVMLDVPELTSSQMSMSLALDSITPPAAVGTPYASYTNSQGALNNAILHQAALDGFVVVETAKTLCHAGECTSAENGRTYYRDSHHLTDFGSEKFNAVFQPLLKDVH